ncbi:hypothetical protein OROHE_012831 [Orobanche hederae]
MSLNISPEQLFMNGYTTGIRYAPCAAEELYKDANWIPSQQINAWIFTKGVRNKEKARKMLTPYVDLCRIKWRLVAAAEKIGAEEKGAEFSAAYLSNV